MPFIEEVDDDEIDNKHFSIDDFDSHNPFSKDTPVEEGAPVQLRPTAAANRASSQNTARSGSSQAGGPGFGANADFSAIPGFSGDQMPTSSSRTFKTNHGRDLPEHMKSWSVLYPVYFDRSKSVKQGRRVPMEFAVENPLAVTIADACRSLGFEPALELTKTHPKDWSNPGRVRINLPEGKSKRELYGQLAKFLKSYPLNANTTREQMYRQVAQFDSMKPLARPRNMPLLKTLPGLSPALSAQKNIEDAMKIDGNDMAKMMGMGG